MLFGDIYMDKNNKYKAFDEKQKELMYAMVNYAERQFKVNCDVVTIKENEVSGVINFRDSSCIAFKFVGDNPDE